MKWFAIKRQSISTIDPAYLKDLSEVLQQGRDRHHTRPDAYSYNIATVVALAATTAATIIPYQIWAKVAAAVATFLIAITRAIDLAGRWRWRWEMRMGYQILLDRIDEIKLLPENEKLAAIRAVYDQLEELRKRESGIPGTAANTIGF